ncbi:MAG: hypothetical protein ACP5KA_05195 [Desulfurococcaceae archaeon]
MQARRALPILIGIVLASMVAVNAAVFAYRWLTATITVQPPTQASGAACTGFYSSSAQPGIDNYLPKAGTNYNAVTYGTNTITVTPGSPVCQWTVGTTTYSLYESIHVSMQLTNGSWYIRDFYGFGYNGTAGGPKVYVWINVSETVKPTTDIAWAELRVYNATTGELVAIIDLLTNQYKYGTLPIELKPGEALQLDLNFKSTASSEKTYSFKVTFYVSQQPSEAPR